MRKWCFKGSLDHQFCHNVEKIYCSLLSNWPFLPEQILNWIQTSSLCNILLMLTFGIQAFGCYSNVLCMSLFFMSSFFPSFSNPFLSIKHLLRTNYVWHSDRFLGKVNMGQGNSKGDPSILSVPCPRWCLLFIIESGRVLSLSTTWLGLSLSNR